MSAACLPLLSVRQLFITILFVFFHFILWAQDSVPTVLEPASVQMPTADSHIAPQLNAPIAQKINPPKPSFQAGQSRNKPTKGSWLFIGLGVFLLLGLLRFFYHKYLLALLDTLSRSTLQRLSGGEQLWQSASTRWLFLVVYFLSSGFIVGQFMAFLGVENFSAFTLWMMGSGIMFGAFLYKYLMLQAVSVVFRFSKITHSFFRHIIVINQIMALVMLPICGILLLVPATMGQVVLLVGVAILGLSLLFKFLINLGYVRNSMKLNYIHFIVYLCTLEFIPLAVLIRYAYDGFGG